MAERLSGGKNLPGQRCQARGSNQGQNLESKGHRIEMIQKGWLLWPLVSVILEDHQDKRAQKPWSLVQPLIYSPVIIKLLLCTKICYTAAVDAH